MNIDLSGRNAIVSGSTQGIGRASAFELAKSGARVTLLARNEDALKATVAELNAISKGHNYLVCDFTRPGELKEIIGAYAANNTIHILVNNTGGPPAGPVADATVEAFTAALGQHLLCNHILVQACLPSMKEAAYGRIINIISTSVKQPIRGLGVSNTTRAAVANWAKTLSVEVAAFGITVNNVLPGATKTQRLTEIIKNKSAKAGHAISETEQEMLDEIPAARFAAPEEIAFAVAFLASAQASYINGINLPVDGGRTTCL